MTDPRPGPEARRLGPACARRPHLAAVVVLAATLAAATGVWRAAAGPFSLVAAVTTAMGSLVIVSVAAVLLLRWVRPPTSAFMVRTRRQLRRSGDPTPLSHEWSDYDAIAPTMRLAAIAAEDSYFAIHRGFDWESIQAAFHLNRESQRVRGGSTISQQVAKNLFLWPARSYPRKALEAYFTILIEALWSKRRILEVYLNIAQFGPSVFGAAAAARVFMGKRAGALTRQEAALLAAVLPSPTRYEAVHPSPFVRLRQVLILDNMKRLGEEYLGYL